MCGRRKYSRWKPRSTNSPGYLRATSVFGDAGGCKRLFCRCSDLRSGCDPRSGNVRRTSPIRDRGTACTGQRYGGPARRKNDRPATRSNCERPRQWRRRGPRPPIEVTPLARQVHQDGFVFDGHNDLPWAVRSKGRQFIRQNGHRCTPIPTPHGHSPAESWQCRRPVLVGLRPRAYGDRGHRSTSDARANRTRPDDGQTLSRRVPTRTLHRRYRAQPPGRKNRLADRCRRRSRDRGLAPEPASIVQARRPLYDVDALRHTRLGGRGHGRGEARRTDPFRRSRRAGK